MDEQKEDTYIQNLKAKIDSAEKGEYSTPVLDWRYLSEEKQIKNIALFDKMVEIYKDNLYELTQLWEGTCDYIKNQNSTLIPMVLKNASSIEDRRLVFLWSKMPKEQQLKYKNDLLDVIKKQIETISSGLPTYSKLITSTAPEIQVELWDEIVSSIEKNTVKKHKPIDYSYDDYEKDYYEQLSCFISNTTYNVQLEKKEFIKEIFNNLINDFDDLSQIGAANVWSSLKIKDEIWNEIFENPQNKNTQEMACSCYKKSNYEFQKKHLQKIEEFYSDDSIMVWDKLCPELQSEKWDEYEKKCSDNVLDCIYFLLCSEVNEEHTSFIKNLIEENINQKENIILIWESIQFTKLQEEYFDLIFNILKNGDMHYLGFFWLNTNDDIQKEKFDKVFFNEDIDDERLLMLWNKTSFKMQNKKIDYLMDIFSEDNSKKIRIWSNTNWFIQVSKSDEMFEQLFDSVKNDPDLLTDLWIGTYIKLQEENEQKLNDIINILGNDPQNATKILNNTNIRILKKDIIEELIQHSVNNEDLQTAIEKYKILQNINPEIYKTINLGMLTKEMLQIFDDSKLARISADIEIQSKLVKYSNSKAFLKIIEYITKDDDWIIELNDILSKIDEYSQIFDVTLTENLDEKSIKQIISCISGTHNYFNIRNIDEAKNFSEKRKRICLSILNDEDVTNEMSEEFFKYDKNERKIFALLELAYGIDIESAKNLVYKYGTDIDKIEGDNDLIETLKIFKIMLNTNEQDIDMIFKQNKETIQNWESIEYSNISIIESKILKLYNDLYNQKMQVNEKHIGYDDDIEIVEVDGEFMANVRVEGAYSMYVSDKLGEQLEQVNPKFNGNCTSFVSNELFAVANNSENKPIVCYDVNEKFPLELLAPWDIASDLANKKFSPGSVKYDYMTGIQFRIPQELINSTRHNHNEAVKRKWYFDKNRQMVYKERPIAVMYVQPKLEQTDEERENTIGWKTAKKAAKQLGNVKIRIVNLEKILIEQQREMEELKNIFLGKAENTLDLTNEELIEKMIIKFENNRVTMRYVPENLQQNYFTNKDSKELYSMIKNRIEEIENPDEAKRLNEKFKQVLINELRKTHSITGMQVEDEIDYKEIKRTLESYIPRNLTDFGMDENEIKNLSDILKETSKLNFYDNNKSHSIEHIEKVILFSSILAHIENLDIEDTKLLQIAAAFHDSGRDQKDRLINHAEASCKKISEFLYKNPENSFGITKENIGILQTIIHYHEYDEKIKGRLDLNEIEKLCKKYNVKKEDFIKTAKLCGLLKDADALDRYRFAVNGKINRQYLRNKSAKDINVCMFAEMVNRKLARQILLDVYNKKESEIETEKEIMQLRNTRKEVKDKNFIEQHLDLEKLFSIYGLNSLDYEISAEDLYEAVKNVCKDSSLNMDDLDFISMGTKIFDNDVNRD